MPSGLEGRPGGTAQKNGRVVRLMKSGAGFVNRTTSVFPRATTPVAVFFRPASTSAAPTMSCVNIAPGEWTPGARVRLIACANAFARTGDPSLKRNPFRRRNVNRL